MPGRASESGAPQIGSKPLHAHQPTSHRLGCEAFAVLLAIIIPGELVATAASAQPVVIPAEAGDGLRLGTGDRVTITVFGQTEMTGDYLIGEDGRVIMPLIGAVAVAGLTVPQLQKFITAQLADGYLREPIVGARIKELRPIAVIGDVKSPGSYTFQFGATVLSAVALAGGFGRADSATADPAIDFIAADERVRSLEGRLLGLSLKFDRLSAQRDNIPSFDPLPPAGLSKAAAERLMSAERALFDTETSALSEEIETLEKQKPKIEADTRAVQEQLEMENRQLTLIRDHISGFNQLMESGYARRYTGIELQREESRNRGNIARLRSELARLDLSVLENELRIQAARSTYRRRVLTELDTVRIQIDEIQVTLPVARELRAARLLKAGPVLSGDAEFKHNLTIVRTRDRPVEQLEANELTALLPGDIVKVALQAGKTVPPAISDVSLQELASTNSDRQSRTDSPQRNRGSAP